MKVVFSYAIAVVSRQPLFVKNLGNALRLYVLKTLNKELVTELLKGFPSPKSEAKGDEWVQRGSGNVVGCSWALV